MKNTIDKNSTNIKQFIIDKNIYIQEIIENTISSIQTYKRINLFSENDINLSLSILLDLYEKINKLNNQMNNSKENINTDNSLNELQKIIDKLSLVICGFGTKKIEDMLFVCFGSDFKNLSFDNPILSGKLKLITKYLHPISYKLIPWKNSKNKITNPTNYCCSKITEDIMELENLNQIECLNENDIDDIPTYEKINHIRCIIQNKNIKKTLIINCIADNIPIHNLNNLYIKYRINELEELKTIFDDGNCDIYSNIVSSLSLKDILIYSKDDIHKRVMLVNKDVNFIKQNHIDTVAKKFL